MSEPSILPNPSQSNIYGPITAGQMFQRTFTLLRENFKLFFGIVLILIGVEIIIAGIFGSSAFWTVHFVSDAAPIARFLFLAPVFAVGAVLLFILVQIVQGALFLATQARLVRAPMTVGEACKLAADRGGRLIGISLLILVRVIGYTLLFLAVATVIGGSLSLLVGIAHVSGSSSFHLVHRSLLGIGIFVLGSLCLLAVYLIFWFWLIARYSLSIPAALAENLPVTESIRRSIHLSHGSRGRLYALLVAMICVDLAIASVTVPLQLLLQQGHNMHAGAIVGAGGILLAGIRLLVYALVMAYIGIATALCYYDLRVRKEGFGVVTPPSAAPIAPAGSWSLPPNDPIGDLPIS